MDLGFTGSTAVVTGGSKGMGLAIAETLAAEGASVAVMARGRDALDAAVASLRAAGAPDAVGISVDMSDADSIAAGFSEVADRWGRLNALVHTIGPGDGYFEHRLDYTDGLPSVGHRDGEADGYFETTEFYERGLLSRIVVDTDGDRRPDFERRAVAGGIEKSWDTDGDGFLEVTLFIPLGTLDQARDPELRVLSPEGPP